MQHAREVGRDVGLKRPPLVIDTERAHQFPSTRPLRLVGEALLPAPGVQAASSSEPPTSVGLVHRLVGAWRRCLVKLCRLYPIPPTSFEIDTAER
jgi:hypothetical protein